MHGRRTVLHETSFVSLLCFAHNVVELKLTSRRVLFSSTIYEIISCNLPGLRSSVSCKTSKLSLC